VVLLQGLAIVGAITQLGFNWFSFFRAHGDTGPPAVEATAGALAFVLLAVPGLLIDGFHGFVVGRIAGAVIALGVRGLYTRRLLPDARLRVLLLPSLLSIGLATAAALVLRAVLWGGTRPLTQAIAELAVFSGVYLATALRRERELLVELLGAVRASRRGAAERAGAVRASHS
jgi:O-antigen/teichoic acid export membrane protein